MMKCIAVLAIVAAVATAQPFQLNDKRKIIDNHGRTRLFHGMNVVYKSPPWHPITDHFDPQLSFSKEDMQYFQDWGMNVVRLGMMWPGMEPSRGNYSASYIATLKDIINTAAEYDIHVVLDVHQDSAAREVCGEGMPDWAVKATVEQKVLDNFPFPLGKPVARDPVTGLPSISDCHAHAWAEYQAAVATGQIYQNWYDSVKTNPNGLREDFAKMWGFAAASFRGLPNVIGAELMNEPGCGNPWKDPALVLPWVADRVNLQPFYDTIAKAVHAADPDRLIMFEPVTWSGQVIENRTTGFEHAPAKLSNHSLYAFHYYSAPNFGNKNDYFARRVQSAELLDTGAFVTEFGLDGSADQINTQDLMDQLQLSWISWEYKAYAGSLPNGTCTGCGRGPLFTNGTVDTERVGTIARTYAQATAGDIVTMTFNATSAAFKLVFAPNAAATAPTEIYVPAAIHYPTGVVCTVTPASAGTCAPSSANKYVVTAAADAPAQVTVDITRK